MTDAAGQTRPKVLITGADGFIGRALCAALSRQSYRLCRVVHGTSRAIPADHSSDERAHTVPLDIGPETKWQGLLDGVGCVIHLAARTHVPLERTEADLAEYRRINVESTVPLAQAAAAAGVRRFVFMSSVKVNGESTPMGPFTENDAPRPEDAYGISKWEAEQAVMRIAHTRPMEAVVLRPPLVYGPGVKGNVLRLLNVVSRAWPLPLASIRNKRSLIFVGNLVDAIIACVDAPAAAGKTYLVSDGEDLSTPELIKALAIALGVRARLVPCPVTLLELGASVLGKTEEIARLTSSLQVDCSRIRTELGWQPRYSLTQGLGETARWFKSREPRIVNAVGEQLPRPDDGDA
jgi:nucleoside-diphosphate-sugar epimerase